MGDYNGYNSGEKETCYLLPISSVFQKTFSQSKGRSSFFKRVKIHQYICQKSENTPIYSPLLHWGLNPMNCLSVPCSETLMCIGEHRRARPGEWTKDPACWANCSCQKMWPVWSWAFFTTGHRQQGKSVLRCHKKKARRKSRLEWH